MLFSEIVGLDEIKQALIRSALSGKVAHAQLFAGSEGFGQLPLALAYAQYLNCTYKQPHDACGKCSSCLQFHKLIHPDLHFIFPTTTTKRVTHSEDVASFAFLPEWREFLFKNPYGSLAEWIDFLGVENKLCSITRNESRNIIKALSFKTFSAEYKIMLIWLPELMQTETANAILKVLEEPSPQTVFLLVTNARDKVLPTILSRTQVINVRPFSDEEIQQTLVKRFEIPLLQAQHAAFLAEGNLNEALKMVDNANAFHAEFFQQWMRYCFKANFEALVNLTEQFAEQGRERQRNFFLYSLKIIRESMLARFGGEALLRLPHDSLTFVRNFSRFLSEKNIEELIGLLNNSTYHIERNANPKMLFLNLSIQINRLLNKTLE